MSTSSDLLALIQLLRTSEFTLALVGAGLSASSGIPTFRGEGSSWRGRDIKSLATRSAFAQDPLLVWQFYEDRRRRAIDADPNGGHRALAKLADMKENFLAITQNVDGLSERAGHDSVKLAPIHGSLLIAKCFDSTCTFQMCNSDTLPLTPTLRLPDTKSSDPNIPLPTASIHELPHCPQCRKSLLRPGVVWFGEPLPLDLIDRVDDWLDDLPRVDLMLVIGTSTRVFPAAEYISRSREKGARVAHFNLEADEHFMSPEDWFIKGDVASTLADIIDSAFEPERYHPGA